MNKEKLLNNLAFSIGVITIVFIAIFRNNIFIEGIIAGIGALLYGICIMFNKNTSGYLFFSIGVSLSLALGLYNYKVLDKEEALTFMICMSVFLLMLVTLIFMYINKKSLFKVYSKCVEGEVVNLVKNPNTNKEYYQVIYHYSIDGSMYTVGAPEFINKHVPNIGDKQNIYVDANDPSNVYFDKSKKEKIYNVSFCVGLMLVSLIIVISLFI